MNCYRTNCKCDDIKKMYCLFRLSKVQQEVIAKIRKHKYCDKCGNQLIKAKYKGRYINLCTECGVRRERIA